MPQKYWRRTQGRRIRGLRSGFAPPNTTNSRDPAVPFPATRRRSAHTLKETSDEISDGFYSWIGSCSSFTDTRSHPQRSFLGQLEDGCGKVEVRSGAGTQERSTGLRGDLGRQYQIHSSNHYR